MTKLIEIEGIGEAHAAKFGAAGVSTVESLLEKGATPKGRAALEEATGIRHALILEWVNHADLFRVDGVGSEYSDLLEAAGVDTVAELAQRNAENLHKAMAAKNAEKEIVRRLPSQKQVSGWITSAKSLPRIVSY